MKQIAIDNLPHNYTERDVGALVAVYGRVKTVFFKGVGKERVAYVDMSRDAEADRAIAALNGTIRGLNSLNVSEARPRQEYDR